MEQAEFLTITLDSGGRALSVEGRSPVALRAKSFQMLQVLAGAAPEPVTKDHLMSRVWPDRIVSEDSIVQCIRDIRRALGTTAPTTLQTVPGLGYRLRARVVGAEPMGAARHTSVAVLTFDELGGADPAPTPFALGLHSDLIYELSRANAFQVVSPTVLGDGMAPGDALRHLARKGVRYALTGTAQVGQNTLKVVALLTECATDTVVWSQRWQLPSSAMLDLQERVVFDTVNELANIWSGQVARLNGKGVSGLQTRNMTAYDLFHRSVLEIAKFTPEGLMAGLSDLERAVTLDPDYGEAWAARANAFGILAASAPPEEVPNLVAGREASARRAFACRPLRGWAILCGAWLAAYDGKDSQAVRDRIFQAVADQPYNADLLVGAAAHGVLNSDLYDEARLWVDRAVEINANWPSWYFWPLGMAHFLAGDNDRAIASLAQAPQNYTEVLAFRAAAEAASGNAPAAARTGAALASVHPQFSTALYLSTEPLGADGKHEWITARFADAGLPP